MINNNSSIDNAEIITDDTVSINIELFFFKFNYIADRQKDKELIQKLTSIGWFFVFISLLSFFVFGILVIAILLPYIFKFFS